MVSRWRAGPTHSVLMAQVHEKTPQSTLHARSGDHARHIAQHTACTIHHISHIIQHTPCIIHHMSHTCSTQHTSYLTYVCACVDIKPGMFLCVLQPTVQNAAFHRGEGKMMMMMMMLMMRVLTLTLVCTCVFCNPVYRTLHSTGGGGKMMMMFEC